MKIVLIGAGNLATNLGKALRHAGHDIVQVFSRTAESADALAHILQCPSTTCLSDVSLDADVCILSVKDSALADIASQVLPGREHMLFLHTAGSMPMDVFAAGRRGVFYPMQTFSKSREVDFRCIPCFVEASSADDLECVRRLASTVSDRVYNLTSDQRKYLHVAAVFCCNFVNHCYAQTESLLKEHDIPFDVMLPLIDETAEKVHVLSPREAQTGPAVRWDENVIARHESMLQGTALDIYHLMSHAIHEMQKK